MDKSYEILMIEDDIDIYNLTRLYFERESHMLVNAPNAREAIRYLHENRPDLILMDVILPDITGFELIGKVQAFCDVPVIFLTSKCRIQDQLFGLKSGAEDYILKPFHPQLLLEKVKLYLARNRKKKASNPIPKLRFNGMTIDYENESVTVGEKNITITYTEFQILSILAENPGRYFTAEAIYEKIWFENSMGDTRGVLVHISNLRKKLINANSNRTYIMTKRNYGYKFNEYLCLE